MCGHVFKLNRVHYRIDVRVQPRRVKMGEKKRKIQHFRKCFSLWIAASIRLISVNSWYSPINSQLWSIEFGMRCSPVAWDMNRMRSRLVCIMMMFLFVNTKRLTLQSNCRLATVVNGTIFKWDDKLHTYSQQCAQIICRYSAISIWTRFYAWLCRIWEPRRFYYCDHQNLVLFIPFFRIPLHFIYSVFVVAAIAPNNSITMSLSCGELLMLNLCDCQHECC